MNNLNNFITSVDKKNIADFQTLPKGSLGSIVYFLDNIDDINEYEKAIIVLGIPEDRGAINNRGTGTNLNDIRKELYTLYAGNWNTPIIDLGNINRGAEYSDTEVALRDILVYLLKKKFLPILLGGSQSLTYTAYRAFDKLEQKVNLTVVDAKFDLGVVDDIIDSHSYLTKIVLEKPTNLFKFTNIGYQTFLNSQEEINLLDTLLFDTYRLGVVKNNIEIVEPILRDSDILSIDLGAIRRIDAPANSNTNISGFNADEICKITRYAGLSDKISILGIYEYNDSKDIRNQTAQLIAQMLWYYIEGINYRSYEFPTVDLTNFKKYMVVIDDETYQFYKSDKSGRWWMEINVKDDNKIKRRTLVPCTYQDYLSASNNEIPNLWYINRRKLS